MGRSQRRAGIIADLKKTPESDSGDELSSDMSSSLIGNLALLERGGCHNKLVYKVKFTKEASENLKKLDKRYQKAVAKAINKLSQNPKISAPLVGKLKGFWKLRFSRYRIIYQIIEKQLIVIVFEIRHRKDVYRN